MAQALHSVRSSLPYLTDNSPDSCPVSLPELRRYLRANADGGEELRSEQLAFVRTAQVEDCRYWMWRAVAKGVATYALVMEDAEGAWMSCRRNDARRPPEEILLDDFHCVRE